MPDLVYVLYWFDDEVPDRCCIGVYADRDDALRSLRDAPEWMRDYASHSGFLTHLTPDPSGYHNWEPAPGPGRWCTWSEAAMAKRRELGVAL